MAESSAEDGFDAAAARLDRAFSRLEASVRSLNGRMRSHVRIEAEAKKLMAERVQLRSALDKASSKAQRLDDSAADVARRLVTAMESVREVLAKES